MTAKERLHQLISEMNDDQAAVLLMDLEEPPPRLSDDERRAIGEARRELAAGRGIPNDEVMQELRRPL